MDQTNRLIIRQTITAPNGWDDALWERMITFWQGRGFVFSQTQSSEQVVARRGNYWGNLTSFDMSKLRTTLTVIRLSPTVLEFVYDIDTLLQAITEWNEAYWYLELATAESWILHNDDITDQWRDYWKNMASEAVCWMLTFGRKGSKRSPR